MRRLPLEILCAVFDQCVTSWVDDETKLAQQDVSSRLDKTPLLLASVCRYWRGTMLVTPRFWSSISLRLKEEHLETDVEWIKLWLARAQSWPLSIDLAGDLRPSAHTPGVQTVMKEFASRSNYWRNIRFQLHISAIQCLSLARGHLPELLRLWVWISINQSSDNIVDTFEFAPQLRCLQLMSPSATSSFKAPWNTIVHCDLHGCYDAQINLDILEMLSTAETCILAPGTLPIDSATHRSVRPPKLHSLTYTVYQDPGPFLHALQLPTLESLVMNNHSELLVATSQLTSLLAHCVLRKLVWWGIDPGDINMIEILRATPALKELHLMHGAVFCMSKNFLAHFAHDPDVSALVPMLQTIKLDQG